MRHTVETWQVLLSQLNAEYRDVGAENPRFEVYNAVTGDRLVISSIYNEDGIICMDVESAS